MLTLLLTLGAWLFCGGLYLVLSRRNGIAVLAGVELMLNASNINLVAFTRSDYSLKGELMALFIIVLAVAEVAIAFALLYAIFKREGGIMVDGM